MGKSNFELGDEQPLHPTNTPIRRSYHKPTVNPVTGEEIGQPGQFFTPQREHAPPQPVSQDRLITEFHLEDSQLHFGNLVNTIIRCITINTILDLSVPL